MGEKIKEERNLAQRVWRRDIYPLLLPPQIRQIQRLANNSFKLQALYTGNRDVNCYSLAQW